MHRLVIYCATKRGDWSRLVGVAISATCQNSKEVRSSTYRRASRVLKYWHLTNLKLWRIAVILASKFYKRMSGTLVVMASHNILRLLLTYLGSEGCLAYLLKVRGVSALLMNGVNRYWQIDSRLAEAVNLKILSAFFILFTYTLESVTCSFYVVSMVRFYRTVFNLTI